MAQFLLHSEFWVGVLVAAVVAALIVVRKQMAIRRLQGEIKRLGEEAEKARRLQAQINELEASHRNALGRAHADAEEVIRTVLRSAMRTLQGLGAEQRRLLDQLQEKYGNSPVLSDLLLLDHMNGQFVRRAKGVAVICGGFAGRRNTVASIYDVIRGAQGMIKQFDRVRIFSKRGDYGIVPEAVEPVALAVAELLENATSFSRPETEVEVNIFPVEAGVCIRVDDAGVGMDEVASGRAAWHLSNGGTSGLAGLGNPPQFGFAVIARLSRTHGFGVSVDATSPYGGVRAVVHLPAALLTSMPGPTEPAPVAAPASMPDPDGFHSTQAPAIADGGLPRRQRKAPSLPTRPDTTAHRARRDPADQARIYGALQRGTQSGRGRHASDASETISTSDESEGPEIS